MSHFKQIISLCSLIVMLASCGGSDETPRLARNTRASEPEAEALFQDALTAEKAGQFKKARKRYRTITNKYPLYLKADKAAYQRGRLLEQAGEPLEAFEAYNDVLTKYPASSHYADSMARQEKIARAAANGNITQSFIGLKSRISVKDTAQMLTQVRDNAPRAPSAARSQYTLGRLFQQEGDGGSSSDKAVAAYRELTREYPNSQYAPDAQFQIGKILLSSAKEGNQDTANLDRAKQAFDDLLLRYPDSQEAKLARVELAKLARGEIERTFNIAEFYRKKGNIPSALFYYQETVNRSKSGSLRAKAQGWINQLSQP